METEVKIEATGSGLRVTGILEKPIKIPSQLFPLTGPTTVFTAENTAPFDGESAESIKRAFDSVQYQPGFCYENAQALLDALSREGVNADAYAGWLFSGATKPIHHCFVLVEDRYVLDFAPDINRLTILRELAETTMGLDATREALSQAMADMRSKANSDYCIFGKVPDSFIYVAAKCKPAKAQALARKLMQTYPKHPCYASSKGLSKTQELYYQKRRDSQT